VNLYSVQYPLQYNRNNEKYHTLNQKNVKKHTPNIPFCSIGANMRLGSFAAAILPRKKVSHSKNG